jgi:hypothetical protein
MRVLATTELRMVSGGNAPDEPTQRDGETHQTYLQRLQEYLRQRGIEREAATPPPATVGSLSDIRDMACEGVPAGSPWSGAIDGGSVGVSTPQISAEGTGPGIAGSGVCPAAEN